MVGSVGESCWSLRTDNVVDGNNKLIVQQGCVRHETAGMLQLQTTFFLMRAAVVHFIFVVFDCLRGCALEAATDSLVLAVRAVPVAQPDVALNQ